MDEPYVDPSQLTDEELDAALNGETTETPETPESSDTPEETPEAPSEEPEEPEAPAEEPEVPEEAPEEEPKPSRRESLRIQKLISNLKQTRTDAPQEPKTDKAVDYREMIDAPDEVYDKLSKTTEEYGDRRYQEGSSQAAEIAKSTLFHTRLEIDAPKVEGKYKQLDKTSSEFNPAVADAVNTWYLNMVGYDAATDTVQNTDVRYSEFVEGFFELVNETAGEKNLQTQKNVVKQAAATGLRPDGSQAKRMNLNQAPGSMSDEELDAVIAQAL